MDAGEQSDAPIAGLAGWRGNMLAGLRRIIGEAGPEVAEEWKWRGAQVFSDHGIVCVANAFSDKVKLTFYAGAGLPDPDRLFNSLLEGSQWRTIDLYEGDQVNESALQGLVRAAVALNRSKAKPAAKKKDAR